jgi:hypothetical protein
MIFDFLGIFVWIGAGAEVKLHWLFSRQNHEDEMRKSRKRHYP